MAGYRVLEAASVRLDEIYQHTATTWGDEQAERYIRGLFDLFAAIAARQALSRPVPAEFGVAGYYARYERHFIYWRRLEDGDVGIVTVLHQSMHQMDRFKEDDAPM